MIRARPAIALSAALFATCALFAPAALAATPALAATSALVATSSPAATPALAATGGAPELGAAAGSAAAGAGSDVLFGDANAAFLQGDLGRATAAYEALVAEGIASPELETNLGAAYLRQGKRGLAALHFERALFLDGADDDARVDLAETRKKNVDKLEGDPEDGGAESLARLLAPLPGGAAALLLLGAWTAAWAFFAVRLFLPGRRRQLGALSGGALALSLIAAGVAFGSATGRDLALRRAVVVAQSAPAREGPGEKSASPFEVHEGTTVRIEDEQNGFRRIKLANGLAGWVPGAAVELVVPPGWAGRPIRVQ